MPAVMMTAALHAGSGSENRRSAQTPDEVWVNPTPEQMAADTVAGSPPGSNGRWMTCARWCQVSR